LQISVLQKKKVKKVSPGTFPLLLKWPADNSTTALSVRETMKPMTYTAPPFHLTDEILNLVGVVPSQVV
jgi:hypothetical protein